MKKFLRIFLLSVLALAVGSTAALSITNAAVAPPLTAIRILAVGSDQSKAFAVPAAYPNKVNVTLKGSMLYIRTLYMGYPNWNLVIYHANGSPVRYTQVAKDPINNPATGWYETVAIPFAELGGSVDITLTARTGTYNPNGAQEQTAAVRGITLVRQ